MKRKFFLLFIFISNIHLSDLQNKAFYFKFLIAKINIYYK
jgi:hypothetical protein